jgi:hypothetical protein
MVRTMEERSERQRALKDLNEERWDSDFLKLEDCARIMKTSRSTARRIFRNEPDVELVRTPGSHRPIIRVPRAVFDRVMRRSANPYRRT